MLLNSLQHTVLYLQTPHTVFSCCSFKICRPPVIRLIVHPKMTLGVNARVNG